MDSITCPRCGRTSYNIHDVEEGYCGACHDWTTERTPMTEPSSPLDDPEFLEFAKHVTEELVPMIQDSAMTISLVPHGPSDVKFAIELGLSIMMDKPIIAVIPPGVKIPDHLVRVADRIVEGDLEDKTLPIRLGNAMNEIADQLDRERVDG